MTTDADFDFAGLYRRYAPSVFRYALFLCGDRMQAEDIVSETFVRVWGARERVDLSSVRSYLLAIARNVFLQGLRRNRREAPLDDAMSDPAPRPDASHQISAELARAMADLAALPESDRTALLLRVDEELSYDDIASILDITPVAARVKVHRARARLTQMRKDSGS
ncbi:MAG: sigma-70 family RNA polymerase sigma factor [bacterium]|nr:sigma-70 family RNA polymerase sigma factor [bacterium]MBK7771595.1 sigma-70 family RNA polymerase sigma factor [bacterium]MBK9471780.1 sigma-70 family RNA polymerase sigma factor [bacterium]MBK9777735.1 sigma-70 family RNA polymerase sigma factor [bacterium]